MNCTIIGNKIILDNNEYELPSEITSFLLKKLLKIDDLVEQNEFLMERDNRCQVLEQVIEKLNDVINEMIYQGYRVDRDGIAKQFFATGKSSEFGIRAEIILDILKEAKGTDINVGRVK